MATGTTTQQTVDVVTPAAGESVTEGTILEWHFKVGDPIKLDETIVEISTDKVDVELPSPATGTVSEILVGEGETVTVGQVIARISVDGAGPSAATAAATQPPAQAQDEPRTAERTAPPGDQAAAAAEGTKASPVAARAAAVEGVDLTRLEGSGPAGRITKSDVLAAAGEQVGEDGRPNGGAATAAPVVQPMRGGAAALARYMEESRSIPT